MDYILTFMDVFKILMAVSLCFILEYIMGKIQNNKK